MVASYRLQCAFVYTQRLGGQQHIAKRLRFDANLMCGDLCSRQSSERCATSTNPITGHFDASYDEKSIHWRMKNSWIVAWRMTTSALGIVVLRTKKSCIVVWR